MAKFKIEVEPEKIIKTLYFMGKEFLNTWVPWKYGSKTLEKAFEDQVKKQFPSVPDDLMELIEEIGCMDEDELQDALEQLSTFEELEAAREKRNDAD